MDFINQQLKINNFFFLFIALIQYDISQFALLSNPINYSLSHFTFGENLLDLNKFA